MPSKVATWEIPFEDLKYKIEFDHGTTSGRRVVYVNDKEVVRKDWLFKLVGSESFEIGQENKIKCEIIIKSSGGFSYQYNLLIDGESIDDFKQKQQQKILAWSFNDDTKNYRITLNKETLDVWVNGNQPKVENIFTDDGTEINFSLNEEEKKECSIKVVSSGKKKEGIIYNLFVNNVQIADIAE